MVCLGAISVSSSPNGCQKRHQNSFSSVAVASVSRSRSRLVRPQALLTGSAGHDTWQVEQPTSKSLIGPTTAAFAAAVFLLAPGQLASPALAAEALSSSAVDVDILRSAPATSKLSDLTSWLTDKLRPPDPESARVDITEDTTYGRSNIVQRVKDAASAAANKAAEAASKAAEAANRAAERSGLTASPDSPIDVSPNSELLSSVAKPSPAPGKGPVEAAARAEARSESSEPVLRADAVAGGQPKSPTGGDKRTGGECCCDEELKAVEGGKVDCVSP